MLRVKAEDKPRCGALAFKLIVLCHRKQKARTWSIMTLALAHTMIEKRRKRLLRMQSHVETHDLASSDTKDYITTMASDAEDECNTIKEVMEILGSDSAGIPINKAIVKLSTALVEKT